MENIQTSSYSYVLEEISPIFFESLVEFREDIACFQNIGVGFLELRLYTLPGTPCPTLQLHLDFINANFL